MPSSRQYVLAVALAGLLGTPLVAGKQPAAPLKREGKWEMDYAQSACHLTAAFGTQPDRVIARFTQVGPGEALRLSLYGKPLGRSSTPFARARVTFLPAAAQPDWTDVTNGSINQNGGELPAVFIGGVRLDNRTWQGGGAPNLPPVTLETEKAVNALSFVQRGGETFTLDLQSMAGPMAAMRRCTEDLVREWGFDSAELATRQSRAVPRNNPAFWATSPDYPAKMLFKGSSAFVTFRVAIDEAGAVNDCFVLETTNPPEIGPHTCGLIKQRARFTPARDKDGKPVKDYYINRVFWKAAG
ncbi:MAG: hypothetical protein RL339_863 [Pseudomonadota bacterium]|jgi:hypothetical protein